MAFFTDDKKLIEKLSNEKEELQSEIADFKKAKKKRRFL